MAPKRGPAETSVRVATLCALLLAARTARAWVYPEHRTISRGGLERLDADRRAVLDELWAAARRGHEARLCEQSVPREASEAACIDYTAWPALGGDHSCSAAEMLEQVLTSDWVLRVERIGARLRRRLAEAQTRARRINALRDSDLELQRADRHYATRAGSNHAHFLLALPHVNTTPAEYARAALADGVELNALAVYAWYHGEALAQAHLLAASLAAGERAQRAAAALADEAFALHFLEDAFAAGHVAGTWGSASLRKGTHDYYNEHGLDASTWTGERAVLTGDAWMRPEDSERAGASVARSVEQLLDAARGGGALDAPRQPAALPPAPSALDICQTETIQRGRSEADALLTEVLAAAPVPMLASGLGAMPRFRSELGPFVGMQAAARGMSLSGGFGQAQAAAGVTGGLELGARVGIGLEGVMDEAGDGLVFLDVALRRDGSSTSHAVPDAADAGALGAAIPARFGYELRLRAPFWLVPFDLLVLAPVLALVSPVTLQSMAVMAGNGGLIPWQAGIATPIGRFQFILGREIAATLFGSGRNDRFVIPLNTAPDTQYALLDLRSVQIEAPLLEYRPFRTFSDEQSSSLVIQAFAGLDIPFDQSQVAPANLAAPDVRAVWFFGLRLSFDWRYYF
jgi:hypothetical protein